MTTAAPITTTGAVRRLADVRLADAAEVGAKAASLGELLAAGARVPDGFVLTAGAAAMGADERRSVLDAAVIEIRAGPFAVRSSGVTEDGAEHSFAGMYETVLDVAPADVPAAADRVLASGGAARVAAYDVSGHERLAVLVQRMVRPIAAGVALTADPVSGDRGSCVVTAVRGVGERLVSGAALGDEWVVQDRAPVARRQPEQAIDAQQAAAVAEEARRIAAARGVPQDVEWAIDSDGALWILQARPMTALPPDVSWAAPAAGAYSRNLRFGEWIAEPVTPLFESWLLSRMEVRFHGLIRSVLGQRAPLPHHVVVNGWYFYSLNWLAPRSLARSLPSIVWHVLRDPRRAAGVIPPTVRFSVPLFERDWRDDLQPRYRAAVADADAQVEALPVSELPALVDGLADLAAEYFLSLVALAGAAYKMEINLALFYRRHLAPPLGGSHLTLLVGLEGAAQPAPHALLSLDWWHAPQPAETTAGPSAEQRKALTAQRHEAERAAERAIASQPRRLRAFRRLLAGAQELVPIREEQVQEWTLPWPVMRRAVVRLGEDLAARGILGHADDVFFLTRDELRTAMDGTAELSAAVDLAGRRRRRDEQARLVPPLTVGRLSRPMQALWDSFPRMLGADRSDRALVAGTPASPGRVTGMVRVIRGVDQFDELQPGEVLVAPLTAPAWTPLFARAAAVVTDVGSPAAHASVIAREYGIPAVVGCVDATARLRNGMRVTVDGNTGNVEPG
jgi:pyruvate,water dikinase